MPTKPILDVIGAKAAKRVRGSKRLRKCGIDLSLIYKPSATNKNEKAASSAFLLTLFKKSKLILASSGTSSLLQAFIWPPGPFNITPNFTFLVIIFPPFLYFVYELAQVLLQFSHVWCDHSLVSGT